MSRKPYPSDLSDAQWALLDPLIPTAKPGGRPRAHAERELVDGIRYVLRTGCPWRYLPEGFPPWPTLYAYFRQWHEDGTWDRANATLRGRVRQRAGRAAQPTAAILDSQSARTTEKGGPAAMTGPRS